MLNWEVREGYHYAQSPTGVPIRITVEVRKDGEPPFVMYRLQFQPDDEWLEVGAVMRTREFVGDTKTLQRMKRSAQSWSDSGNLGFKGFSLTRISHALVLSTYLLVPLLFLQLPALIGSIVFNGGVSIAISAAIAAVLVPLEWRLVFGMHEEGISAVFKPILGLAAVAALGTIAGALISSKLGVGFCAALFGSLAGWFSGAGMLLLSILFVSRYVEQHG